MLTSGIFGKIILVEESKVVLETAPGQKLTVAIGAVRSIEEEPKPALSEKNEAKAKSTTSAKQTQKTAQKAVAKTATKPKSATKTK